jgi:hypothetical protein
MRDIVTSIFAGVDRLKLNQSQEGYSLATVQISCENAGITGVKVGNLHAEVAALDLLQFANIFVEAQLNFHIMNALTICTRY